MPVETSAMVRSMRGAAMTREKMSMFEDVGAEGMAERGGLQGIAGKRGLGRIGADVGPDRGEEHGEADDHEPARKAGRWPTKRAKAYQPSVRGSSATAASATLAGDVAGADSLIPPGAPLIGEVPWSVSSRRCFPGHARALLRSSLT